MLRRKDVANNMVFTLHCHYVILAHVPTAGRGLAQNVEACWES